ncbi:MAG: Fic family protein [Candidatus Eisenbacteria bacterium]|nr:Fic family protein [Candidatus Eisenbacteria bacterium]
MNRRDWHPDRPFNELPPLPSAGDLETKSVLRACIEARAAVAALKQAAELIPNPAMLISTLPLLEAQASSEIENVVTTTDKLFEKLHEDRGADPATKEALRYRQALMEGSRALEGRPLCMAIAEAVCSKIRGVEMRVRRVPGTKLMGGEHEVVYTPPEGEEVIRRLLADWERFMNDEARLDPLIRLAAGHYQFEAIHPFTDGNGRTGRVLNSLFLIQKGLLGQPILYMSRYIIRHRDEYYRLLLHVTRDAAWEPWLLFVVEAVRETACWTLGKIEAIRELRAATIDHVRRELPKIYSRELVDLLFARPYCRIGDLVEEGIAHRQSASRYLKLLAGIGVLIERKVGRERIFIHPRLMRLLTTDKNEPEAFGASAT